MSMANPLVLLALSVLLVVGGLTSPVPHEDYANATYTTKYDNVDIDEIINSHRLMKGYVDCLLDKGHCTPDGLELKRNLPDAINNDCKKCSATQKRGSDKMMHHIIDNDPEWWTELEAKYKTDGSYKKDYLESKKGTTTPGETGTEESTKETTLKDEHKSAAIYKM